MKILMSSIGSRGEVQPILALALELRALGQHPRLCVAPNFKPWIESYGVECIPVGVDVQKFSTGSAGAKHRKPTRAQWRSIVSHTVTDQFRVVADAARGCDLVVVAGGLQSAGRSIAEALKIPYVYAAYCAGTLPSAAHPPPMIRAQRLPRVVNRALWIKSERSWNDLFRDAVNKERAALGLPPVASVPRHIFTERPWLAADSVLSPAAAHAALTITQTGAWLLRNPAPLPAELETFLAAGEAPVYLGFGSMRATPETSRTLIAAARAVGRRAVISQGWGNLNVIDDAADCIPIGDVAHEQLFPRVAAIVHHGGAGTTTAAARAGRAQVIVPHMYDQHYFAERVRRLGIGVRARTAKRLDAAALTAALRASLQPDVATRAEALASRIEPHGARLAAERLIRELA